MGRILKNVQQINNIAAAELDKLNGITTNGYVTVTEVRTFTETSAAGTYTGTVSMPAGSYLLDVAIHGIVLWNAGTSALMEVGDGADPDGFFLSTNLKATDLLAGEVNNIEHPGGKAGAYIGAEQRVLYSTTARDVIGSVVQTGTGTAGVTHMVVTYSVPTAVAATKV